MYVKRVKSTNREKTVLRDQKSWGLIFFERILLWIKSPQKTITIAIIINTNTQSSSFVTDTVPSTFYILTNLIFFNPSNFHNSAR